MNRSLLLFSLSLTLPAVAQVSYTGGVYFQDFNSLQGTTNNTLNIPWTDNTSLPGWYSSRPSYSVTDATIGGSAGTFDSTGSTNNVGSFSFGAAAFTDRALGSRATGTTGFANIYYGVRLVNNTSRTLNKFTVTWTGEQWFKSSAATAHTLLLDYQFGATGIGTGTWSAVTSGTFTAPVATGTTATALDGNAAANRTVKSAVVTGLTWSPGQELWVRFRDDNESGVEQGLAVDDLAFLADDESGLFFNGSSSAVTTGFGAASASSFGASSFTLECRFLRTGSGTAVSTGAGGVTAVPLVARGTDEGADGDSRDGNYFLGIDSNGKLTADFEQLNATDNGTPYAAGQNFPVTGSTTLQNGVWYHVAATYDASTAAWKLFVNGAEETVTAPLAPFSGVVPRSDSIQGLGIGSTVNSTGARAGFFQGVIDEVRVWSIARSPAQILAAKDSKISAGPAGLIARYGLDEATGTTAAGSKSDGSAVTSGTLVGTVLPQWVNSQSFAPNTPPSVTLTSPADGFNTVEPGSIALSATAGDTDGTVSRVEFYQGAVKIGEDTSSPYYFTWTNVPAGNYSLTAVAVDNSNATTATLPVSVTVQPNLSPAVSILSPLDDAVFDAPAAITFTADASDPDGTVAKVEYYNGLTKIGESLSAPWTFVWSNVLSGNYFITATAIDQYGARTTSAVIDLTVTNADNTGPTVTLTAPADGAVYTMGSTVPFTATAADADGIISKVSFYQGTTLLGEDMTAPYSFDWASPLLAGTYDITAVATDNDGATATSATAVVTLEQPPPFNYTQNFNSMGPTGTALPVGWSIKNGNGGGSGTWTTSITANGANSVAAMIAAAGAPSVADNPTTTNNNGFNAAKPGNTADRIVATSPTGNAGTAIQLDLLNNTPLPVSAVRLSYDIQRYAAVSTANELPGYWVFYSLDGGTTWTNISALNPALTGASVNVPNTAGVTVVPATPVSFSTPWAVGATLSLRWVDDNAGTTSPDHIIGLDNVSVAGAIGNPPLATLTSPASGATFFAPATVSLAATASDSDGTVSKVEFYSSGTKIGESSASPYTLSWTGVAAGTYSLTAVAVDNTGNAGASAPVSITVNPAPGSGTLTRGPYLQKAAHNRMTVRWRSGQSVIGRVRYGTSPGTLDQTLDESTATTEHIVEITGLQPNTTYYYSIGSAFDTLASGTDYTFTTSPLPGTAVNTRIWVLGDAGTATTAQVSVRDAFYTWTGTRVPNLVLQLGDNAYNSGTDTEFQNAVFNMYPTMMRRTTFWSCLGNHETAGSTAFVDTYPYFNLHSFPTAGECGGVASGTEHYFSWDYGNIHFISLDSMTASRSTTGAMALWLKDDLASTTATWIVCIFHHPSYSKGSHNSDVDGESLDMRQNFNPILEAGGVDLVLNGHSHSYERSYLLDGHYGLSTTLTPAMKVNGGDGRPAGNGAYVKPLTGPRDHFGTVYSVPGSSGQISGGTLNHPAHFVSLNNLGSVILDVNGSRLDATFLRENGTVPDTYTIFKQGAADSDKDGIPDEWEIANGLDRKNAADAPRDSDGDGLTNLQEYLVGTRPDTVAGAPQIAGFTPQTDGSVSLQLVTVAGKSYRIEANNSFPAGAWVTVAASVTGTGGVVSVSDTGAIGVSNRIYRVTVLP